MSIVTQPSLPSIFRPAHLSGMQLAASHQHYATASRPFHDPFKRRGSCDNIDETELIYDLAEPTAIDNRSTTWLTQQQVTQQQVLQQQAQVGVVGSVVSVGSSSSLVASVVNNSQRV